MAYDPKSSLIHYPEPMARFGLNDFSEPKYRIVLNRSRRSLVHGQGRKPAWLRTYPDIKPHVYVMERWLSAYEFTKTTAAIWNATMTILGPYPSRGEWQMIHAFDHVLPGDSDIGKLIVWSEAGKRFSANENLNAIKGDVAQEKAAVRKQNHDRQMERFPAFGTKPMVGGHVSRGTKSAPNLSLTAQELGLPTKPGRTTKATGKQYSVEHLIEGLEESLAL